MNLSDLPTLGDHILCLHSRSLNLTGNRSIYNAGNLFDNLIKITAFFVIKDEFVVTPQIIPISFASRISSTFAVSIKNFIFSYPLIFIR